MYIWLIFIWLKAIQYVILSGLVRYQNTVFGAETMGECTINPINESLTYWYVEHVHVH